MIRVHAKHVTTPVILATHVRAKLGLTNIVLVMCDHCVGEMEHCRPVLLVECELSCAKLSHNPVRESKCNIKKCESLLYVPKL